MFNGKMRTNWINRATGSRKSNGTIQPPQLFCSTNNVPVRCCHVIHTGTRSRVRACVANTCNKGTGTTKVVTTPLIRNTNKLSWVFQYSRIHEDFFTIIDERLSLGKDDDDAAVDEELADDIIRFKSEPPRCTMSISKLVRATDVTNISEIWQRCKNFV